MIPVLGTAQFGMSYGITNSQNTISTEDVYQLLDFAVERNIKHLDSSINYGNAEFLIGAYKRSTFAISTKVNYRDLGMEQIDNVEAQIRERLGNHVVINCFLHDWPDLNFEERAQAYNLTQNGATLKWGPSIYEPNDVIEILRFFPNFHSIQLPTSILDQRFVPYYQILRENAIEIWARSIFLQGLISKDVVKTSFKNHPDIIRLALFCNVNKIDPIRLGLIFASNADPDFLVFGVVNRCQMAKILDFLDDPIDGPNFDEFASKDTHLLDPRTWKG